MLGITLHGAPSLKPPVDGPVARTWYSYRSCTVRQVLTRLLPITVTVRLGVTYLNYVLREHEIRGQQEIGKSRLLKKWNTKWRLRSYLSTQRGPSYEVL